MQEPFFEKEEKKNQDHKNLLIHISFRPFQLNFRKYLLNFESSPAETLSHWFAEVERGGWARLLA